MKKLTVKKCLFFLCVGLFFLLSAIAFSGCRYNYSRETDPEKYLSFSLLEDGTYAVDGYKGNKTRHLVIPAAYQGVPVTQINDYAFHEVEYWNPWRDAVKSLTIEDGVKYIGKDAFSFCMFERVSLPDSIEYVGAHAFEQVHAGFPLPKNITEIGDEAFYCSGLYGDLDLDGITCGQGAFEGTSITSASLSYEHIPYALFGGSSLASVELKEGVKTIGAYAFSGCHSLGIIHFPTTLETIGDSAFYKSGLTELSIPSTVVEIKSKAFEQCTFLQKLTLSGETILGEIAFSGCSALDSLTLSNYTRSFEPSVFRYCPLGVMRTEGDCGNWIEKGDCLTKTNDENRIFLGGSNADFTLFTKIGAYAFYGRQLYDIEIGENITEIDGYAFRYATIQSAKISAPEISSYAFYYAKFGALSVSSKRICKRAFEYADFEKGIVRVEEGCEVIESYAFVSCSDITTVYLPASLQEIGDLAFGYCPNLISVYYAYQGDSPAYMSSATFCGNQVVWEQGGRYREWRMADGFQIFVKAEIYDYCKTNWTDTPTVRYNNDQYYVFLDRLSDFVVVYG